MVVRKRFLLPLLLLVLGLLPVIAVAQTEHISTHLVIAGHVNACTTGPTGTTGNAYACSFGVALQTLQPQACYGFRADVANTGASTINYAGLGAKAIVKTQGGVTTPLVANDIRPNMLVHTCYDGTNMQMVSPLGNAPAGVSAPGGNPSEVQWHSAGALAGSSGLRLDSTAILTRLDHVTPDSNGLTLGAHNVLTCFPGGTDKTYALPLAATTSVGSYQLIKLDTGAGACVVTPSGTDTINGVAGPLRVASYLEQVQLTRLSTTGWYATVSLAAGVSAQSTTTYTLRASDVGRLVTLQQAAAMAVTLPAAGTDGFGLGAVLALRNLGPGFATLFAGVSTLDGEPTLSLPAGAHVTLWSDGVHYWSQPGFANPMTTAGDVLSAGVGGQAQRVPAGTAKQVLLAGTPPTFSSFPEVTYLPAARCVNNVASAQWSTAATPAAACRAGTNNHEGFLTWGAADTAEVSVSLPLDWDTTLAPAVSLYLASTTGTAGQTIQMQVATACTTGDGTSTDDVAWNAVQPLTLVTTNATANQSWRATLAALTMTNCSAGGLLRLQLSRATDTATTVRVYGLGVTIPRLLTVQAN